MRSIKSEVWAGTVLDRFMREAGSLPDRTINENSPLLGSET